MRLQLGSIIRTSGGEKFPVVIKGISRLHHYEFLEQGILVRNLPGFGAGKLVKVDYDSFQIPRFDGKVLTDPDTFQSKAREHKGEGSVATKQDIMSLDKSDTDIPTMPILDVQQATDSNNQVFSCTNPRCTLKFTLYSAFLKHQNSTDKCVVQRRMWFFARKIWCSLEKTCFFF